MRLAHLLPVACTRSQVAKTASVGIWTGLIYGGQNPVGTGRSRTVLCHWTNLRNVHGTIDCNGNADSNRSGGKSS